MFFNVNTINETGISRGLGKYEYFCHPRYVERNKYYCRIAHSVLSKGCLRKCISCPLMRGCTQGEQSGLPECYYYDLYPYEYNYKSPEEEKLRIDKLMRWHGVPLFPHFAQPGEHGILGSELAEKALQYAAAAHFGATRKGSKRPYIFHPVEAAMIASKLTDDEEVIAAAALHDVAEDTSYTLDDIRAVFGGRIASLVASESEDKRRDIPSDQSWKLRKEEALDHLKKASREAKLICLADKLSNMRDIKADYEDVKDELWHRFNQHDPAAHAWYYGSVRDICEADFKETDAWREYAGLLDEVFSKYIAK